MAAVVLYQFNKDAVGALGMQEGDHGALDAGARLGIDRLYSVLGCRLQDLADIRHSDGNMMYSFAFPFQEFSNRGIGGSWLQAFDPGASDLVEFHSYLLSGYLFGTASPDAQTFFEESPGISQRSYRHSDVVDNLLFLVGNCSLLLH
jgi:hypothetical protein